MAILLKSYHDFKKESGVIDSRVEFLELSSRFLLKNKDQISQIADQNEIFLNARELPIILTDIRKIYLILPFTSFDGYLDNIKNDIKIYFNFDYTIGRDETKYSKIIEILPNIKKAVNITNFENNCLEYYRLIRNSFVHKSTKDDKKINNLYDNIKSNSINMPYDKYRIAPSKQNEIIFEDFILLTVIIKSISKKLAEACNPSIHQVLSNIAWKDIAKKIGYISTNERKVKFILNYLKTDYYLTEEYRDIIIRYLDQQDLW